MKKDIRQNNESNLDLAYDVVSKKLEAQRDAHASLENKIGVLLGFVGIIVGSLIVLVHKEIDLFGLNIFTIGLFGIYLSFLLLATASQTRVYFDPPDFPTFYSESALKKKTVEIKNQVIADMKCSYELNIKNQELKSKLYNIAIYCFVISTLFLFLGILELQL